MLIFDRELLRPHRSWAIGCVVITLASLGWYLAYGLWWGGWRTPSGGSTPGFALGVAGGLIIAFEMCLWPRKALRRYRLGRTQWWMRAHIWLGLLCLPLLLLHGSLRLNVLATPLAAVLSWLLIAVVVSGVYGLVQQNRLPKQMLELVPAETIHRQIPRVLEQYREEGERLVRVTCGEARPDDTDDEEGDSAFLTVSTMRRAGSVQGRVVQAGIEAVWVPGSEPLRGFFDREVVPFLAAASGEGLGLGNERRAEALFTDVKTRLKPEAHAVVDRLADLCQQRRQFDVQIRLHRRLHGWLNLHVALSMALFLLMIVHIVVALKYV